MIIRFPIVILFILALYCCKNSSQENTIINQKTNSINSIDTIVFNCIIYLDRVYYYTGIKEIDSLKKYPLSIMTQKKPNDGKWELVYFSEDVYKKIDSSYLQHLIDKKLDAVLKIKAIKMSDQTWNGLSIEKITEVPYPALMKDITNL